MIRTDSTTGAPTLLYTIVTDRGISWEQACALRASDSPVERNGVVDLEPAVHGESAASQMEARLHTVASSNSRLGLFLTQETNFVLASSRPLLALVYG